MKIHAAGLLALATVLVLAACGPTYVDTDVTVPATGSDATTTTMPPIDPEAPIGELLAEIESLMSDLDERIIDERGQVPTMERIDDLWSVAERRIRAEDPNDVFNFEQAIELARSGVTRRRPADASKGFKIITDVIDAYGQR